MNDLYKYLIELLNAFLNSESIQLSDKVDWKELYIISRKHNLTGIVFSVINNSKNKNIVDEDIFNLFQNTFFGYVYKFNSQMNSLSEAESALKVARIPYVPFKGTDICRFYPVKEVRAMGDLDILVDESNIKSAGSVLSGIGYKCTAGGGYVNDYRKNNILIELHSRVMIGEINSFDVSDYYKNAIDFAKFNDFKGVFERNYNFAILITHIAHHFIFKGAGIKMVFDLAVLLKNDSIDLEKVFKYLSDCNLDKFGKIILTVASKWFNLNLKYDSDEYQICADYICSFGAFGSNGKDPSTTVLRKEIAERNNASPFLTKFHLLFPSYKKMISIPYISFLKGKKYLTPVAWVYRLFYNVINRRKFLANSVKNISDEKTKKEAINELELLKEIGLL